MGTKGPEVIHVGYQPANVEQVYFPQVEVIGDLGPSLRLLADRVEARSPAPKLSAAAGRHLEPDCRARHRRPLHAATSGA